MLLLDRPELADKVAHLRDRLGRVALFVLGVDALGGLVEDGADDGKVAVADVGVEGVARVEGDLAALFLASDRRFKINMG